MLFWGAMEGFIDCLGIRLPFYYKPENRAATTTKNEEKCIEPPHFCTVLCFFPLSTPRFLASLIASKPNICVSGNRIRRRDNDNGNRRLNCPKPRQVAVSSDLPPHHPIRIHRPTSLGF